MNEERLYFLLNRFAADQIDETELAELDSLIREEGYSESVNTAFLRYFSDHEQAVFDTKPYQDIIRHILSADTQIREGLMPRPVSFLQKKWLRYAAAVFLLVVAGTYLWTNHVGKKAPVPTVHEMELSDIGPGKDGAILTLADGRQLVLDSLNNGTIAVQNGTDLKLNNGTLSYNANDVGKQPITTEYNTMITPRGRQFRLTLPDGSRVWLNAASSLRYPTGFNGTDRKVELKGEAYFEIAKDEKKPFKVVMEGSRELEVLGTSFNINSYSNEQIVRATLVDGAVKLNAGDGSKLLKPGQQALCGADNNIKVVQTDIEKVIAWKNGFFNFNDEDLYSVLRQLERWYDIDVEYNNTVTPVIFHGKLQRTLTLSQILEVLDQMEIRYQVKEGRKLVI